MLQRGIGAVTGGLNALPRLARPPKADTLRVSEIIQQCHDGIIRVPDFQRPLRWRAQDVLDLLDSVYSGYPIGVLLLARRPDEPAARLTFGPVTIDAPLTRDANIIVDGQQRVTSLVATLLHPDPRPRGGVFSAWFDLEGRQFRRPIGGNIPDTWVPVNALRDMRTLMRWLQAWPLSHERLDLVERIQEVQDTVLNYRVPVYLLDGSDPAVLRIVFKRVNTTGMEMREEEVFNALFVHDGPKPIIAAANRIHEATGFGVLSEGLLLRCIKCVVGVSPMKSMEFECLDAPVPNDAVAGTEAALRHAITFLQEDVGFPHASITPYPSPVLIVLSRYFSIFPKPSMRSRLLLRWWVWRGTLSKQHSSSSQGYISRLQKLIVPGDDEVVAQAILQDANQPLSIPDASLNWNPRSAEVRVCMAALLAHTPISDMAELPVTPLIDDDIAPPDDNTPHWTFASWTHTRPHTVAEALVIASGEHIDIMTADATWLQSQLIPPAAIEALRRGDHVSFLQYRATSLNIWMQQYLSERHGLAESDRVSIRATLRAVERAA